MADINGNSRKKVEKLTMEEIADRLEGLKSSLDTIRRTASELIMGIDAQLQELKKFHVLWINRLTRRYSSYMVIPVNTAFTS